MYDWKYLKVCLPDDIRMMRDHGDWDSALRLIDKRLERELPEAMRQRLLIEKDMIHLLRREYTYSWEDAVKLMSEELTEFDPSELQFYMDEGTADWHYVDGKLYFHRRFFRTLTATKPELRKKWKNQESREADQKEEEILEATRKKMREQGEVAYRIRYRASLRVKDEYFRPGEKLRVHLPAPALAQQMSEVKILRVSPEPTYIAPEDSSSRTIYFEGAPTENHAFEAEYEFVSRMPYVPLDEERVRALQPDFNTQEQEPHIMFTPYIQELVKELVGQEKNPLKKARAFYDFVTTKVKYTFMRAYFTLENIPEYAAKNLKGDCGVQALLFITLCRAAGIPAKWQSGLCAGPLDMGMHDWAQFYIAPYGWLYADCSYGGSAYRAGNIQKWNHYFGNLDPFRAVINSEFQQEFDPPKYQVRYDPYDNQCGEAEYEDYGLMGNEFETEETLIGIEEL